MEKIKNNDLLQIYGGSCFSAISSLLISFINMTRLIKVVGRRLK